ncbi:MAG: cupin domain-containing protein [Candidatus Limnocylindria bacterium]
MATSTSEVRLIRPEERSVDTQQTAGMTREAAITSGAVWAGFVRTAPGMSSGWHHHGDHETAIYVLKGRARLDFGSGGAASVDAREGDFIHVPPHAIHRESNPTDEEGQIIVVRAGTGAPVVNVEGPAT